MRSEKGKAANRKAQENYRAKHSEKVKAQQKARSSGSGAGHHCQRCGKPAQHKHHVDYGSGKFVWLCHEHHVKAHHPKSNLKKADKLPGGLADKKKPSDFPAAALKQGIKVELEHTKDRALAREIAMDHLTEDLKYYDKLKLVEKGPKLIIRKAGDREAKPGQTGNYVGESPAKPAEGVGFAGRIDKGEALSKPSNVVRNKRDEAKWNRAKAAAKKQGQEGNYRLIMHIYQQMKKSEEPMETFAKAMVAKKNESFEKAFATLVPKEFERGVLIKGMYSDDWHQRFYGSPYEAQALGIEKDYQAACHALEKEHVANRKKRDAARRKIDKLVDQEAPYFDFYGKKHDLREKYNVRKRELLLKLLEHQQKQAEARKSLAKSENPSTLAKSHQEGPMSDHTLSSIYDEIRGMNVDQELAKAMKPNEEPETGEPDPENLDKGGGVPGGTMKAGDANGGFPGNGAGGAPELGHDKKMNKGVPAMVGDAAGVANLGDDMHKSMNSVQQGEVTGQLGVPSANGTVAGGGGASGGQEFNSESKTGMPQGAMSEFSTEQWSDDDAAVEQQLKEGGMKPLERVVPHGGADLGQNASMNAPGMLHKSEQNAGGPQGLQMSQAYATQIGANDMRGVGVGVQASVEQVQKSETPVNYWSNGAVLYSDGEDQRIEKAMNDQGYITPEPTLGIPNSPLTQGHTCINELCKSQMPSFITVCPGCGVDQSGAGYPAPHGAVVMEKSVAVSLRPKGGDLSLPNGVFIPKE